MPDHVEHMLEYVGDCEANLALDIDDEAEASLMRRHERTGRPLGDADFIAGLETLLGRFLTKRRPAAENQQEEQLGIVSPEFG